MIFGGITILSIVIAAVTSICMGDFSGFGWLGIMAAAFLGSFLVLTVLAFLFLLLLCVLVDKNKPQEEDSGFYRFWMYRYIEAAISVFMIRLTAEGLEKTPKDGRFLLVCNHQNHADPGVLHHCFRSSKLAFIAKKESADYFVVGQFMHKTLCQFVNRENDREALKTIIKCIQMIKNDQVSVGVFPEGGIIEDYKVYPFRSGVLKIAQKANVPIVVCTLKGTTDLFRNIKRLKPTDVRMHLLDVIPVEELTGRNTVQLGERIRTMMIADLGEEWRVTEE